MVAADNIVVAARFNVNAVLFKEDNGQPPDCAAAAAWAESQAAGRARIKAAQSDLQIGINHRTGTCCRAKSYRINDDRISDYW